MLLNCWLFTWENAANLCNDTLTASLLYTLTPFQRNKKKIGSAHRQINIFLPATAVLVPSLKMYFYFRKHVLRLHHQAQLAATTTCSYAFHSSWFSSSAKNLVTPSQKNPAHTLCNFNTPSVLARRIYGFAPIPRQQTSKQVYAQHVHGCNRLLCVFVSICINKLYVLHVLNASQ